MAVLLGAAPLAAQTNDWAVGASASAGLFVGDGSDFLDAGFGLDVALSRRIARHVQLRADGMLVLLDEQTGPGETAGNRIMILGLGPELDWDVGAMAFYVRGLVGAAGNMQVRSGSALDEATTWARALGAGAGLRVSLAPTVSLDLGGDVVKLGELDFARTSQATPLNLQDPVLLRLRAGLRFGAR